MMAQKIRDGLQNVKGPSLLSSFPKRILCSSSPSRESHKGRRRPKREKKKKKTKKKTRVFVSSTTASRERKAFRRRVAFFVCEIPIGIFVSKHHHLFNRETTYKSARGKDDHQSRRKDHFA